MVVRSRRRGASSALYPQSTVKLKKRRSKMKLKRTEEDKLVIKASADDTEDEKEEQEDEAEESEDKDEDESEDKKEAISATLMTTLDKKIAANQAFNAKQMKKMEKMLMNGIKSGPTEREIEAQAAKEFFALAKAAMNKGGTTLVQGADGSLFRESAQILGAANEFGDANMPAFQDQLGTIIFNNLRQDPFLARVQQEPLTEVGSAIWYIDETVPGSTQFSTAKPAKKTIADGITKKSVPVINMAYDWAVDTALIRSEFNATFGVPYMRRLMDRAVEQYRFDLSFNMIGANSTLLADIKSQFTGFNLASGSSAAFKPEYFAQAFTKGEDANLGPQNSYLLVSKGIKNGLHEIRLDSAKSSNAASAVQVINGVMNFYGYPVLRSTTDPVAWIKDKPVAYLIGNNAIALKSRYTIQQVALSDGGRSVTFGLNAAVVGGVRNKAQVIGLVPKD